MQLCIHQGFPTLHTTRSWLLSKKDATLYSPRFWFGSDTEARCWTDPYSASVIVINKRIHGPDISQEMLVNRWDDGSPCVARNGRRSYLPDEWIDVIGKSRKEQSPQ
jgi:hypothetical protein